MIVAIQLKNIDGQLLKIIKFVATISSSKDNDNLRSWAFIYFLNKFSFTISLPLWNGCAPETHRNHNLYNSMLWKWSRTIPSRKHLQQSQFFSFHRMSGLSATKNENKILYYRKTRTSLTLYDVIISTRFLTSNHNRCRQNGYNKFGFL